MIEAVKKYLRYFRAEHLQSFDEVVGLRVGLIFRFLSENLSYINIAKAYQQKNDLERSDALIQIMLSTKTSYLY